MPSFGGWEVLVVVLAALLVLGPTKLPELARTCGLWFGRIRRMYTNFKSEFEREVGMDEIRQQLHNEQIMAEMKSLEDESRSIVNETDSALQEANVSCSDVDNEVMRATKPNTAG